MRRVDLNSVQLRYEDDDPEGYRGGAAKLGPDLGASITGTSLYELPPGQSLCPYHYEYGEEEWMLVVSGRATVRTPEGEAELGPMELMFFPRGAEGAHKVSNAGEETMRFLMWSNVVTPSATAYPDSDKVGVWVQDRSENLMAPRSAHVDYFFGET
jgi:uncharacterized cupin superfamily protein